MIQNVFAIGQTPAYQNKSEIQYSESAAIEKADSQKEKIYPKEAEDISEKRVLPRRYSLSQLPKIEEIEKVACEKRNSGLWNCVGRQPVELEKGQGIVGYIYLFEAKSGYNPSKQELDLFSEKDDLIFFQKTQEKCDQKNDEIFPAVEIKTIPAFFIDVGEFEKFKIRFPFEENGTVRMELPDTELLNALIKNYCLREEQKLNKKIGEIKIYSTKGLSDDLSFALTHLKGGVLSDGVEFVHDYTCHILPRLQRLMSDLLLIRNKDKTFYLYHQTEKEMVKLIFSLHTKIEKAKTYSQRLKKPEDQMVEEYQQLNFLLGYTVETIFSVQRREIEDFLANFCMKENIEFVLNDEDWQNCFKKRFPVNTPTVETMQNLWQSVEDAVIAYQEAK